MKRLWKPLLLIFCTCFCACGSPAPAPSVDGIWIGSHRGHFFKLPINVLMDFQEDGEMRFLAQGVRDEQLEWQIYGDSILVDTEMYLIDRLTENTLQLKSKDGILYFYRAQEAAAYLNEIRIPDYLEANWWEIKKEAGIDQKEEYFLLNTFEYLKFDNEDFHLRRDYFYKGNLVFTEWEHSCFRYEDFQQLLFLNYAKRAFTCDSIYARPEQIVELSEDRFFTSSGGGSAKKQIQYNKVEIDSTIPNDGLLEFCEDLLVGRNAYRGIYYQGRMDGMRQELLEGFKKETNRFSGFITVDFQVSCKGEVGRFEIYATDLKAKKVEPESYIIKHLINLIAKLDNWKVEGEETLYDNRYSLTFKMLEGELIAIIR